MDLALLTLRTIAGVITQPYLLVILVMVGVALYFKSKKVVMMQKIMIGESLSSPLELTLSQIVLGILAGAVGSLILSGLGIVFKENSGVEYIFLISVFFMFFKPRFVCFSYSAAFLGTLSLIMELFIGNKILDVDIAMLMTFVGVLHIIEAGLVLVDGSRGSMPTFRTENKRVIGGYTFNRQWMLPIAMLVAFSGIDMATVAGETVGTPSWWPILSSPGITDNLATLLLVMLPFFGVVGYSSTTYTYSKEKKILSSGLHILVFGVMLCFIAQIARAGIVGQILVLIYAPLSHELMLRIQSKREKQRKYMFTSDEGGLSILEVVPNSQAYQSGFRRGDKIISLNNTKVNTETEMYDIAKANLGKANFLVMKSNGDVKEIFIQHSGRVRFGFLVVPIIPVNKKIDMSDPDVKEFVEFLKKRKEDKSN